MDVKLAEVESIDPATRTVTTTHGERVTGDALVLAAGSQPNFFHTAGAEEHARGPNVELFRHAAKLALIVAVPATLVQLSVGNRFGAAVTSAQGMKIAASAAQ